MDTDSFTVHIKTEDIYDDISIQKMLKKDFILHILSYKNLF